MTRTLGDYITIGAGGKRRSLPTNTPAEIEAATIALRAAGGNTARIVRWNGKSWAPTRYEISTRERRRPTQPKKTAKKKNPLAAGGETEAEIIARQRLRDLAPMPERLEHHRRRILEAAHVLRSPSQWSGPLSSAVLKKTARLQRALEEFATELQDAAEKEPAVLPATRSADEKRWLAQR
jgi:hypothetical protein